MESSKIETVWKDMQSLFGLFEELGNSFTGLIPWAMSDLADLIYVKIIILVQKSFL